MGNKYFRILVTKLNGRNLIKQSYYLTRIDNENILTLLPMDKIGI